MGSIFSRERTINRVVLLQIADIVPNPAQPRRYFDQEELRSLAESIKTNGLLQPVSVRKNCYGKYELIAGERRLKASAIAGLATIPAIVVDSDSKDSAVLALIENLERQDLNLFEQAKAIENVINEWGVTQEEAALRLNMAQSTIANKLRLNRLSEEQQRIILENGLTERHARALLKLENDAQRLEALQAIVKNHYNVSQTEHYIEQLLKGSVQPHRVGVIRDVRIFINTINKALNTMQSAGIRAEAKRRDEDDFIEYIVRIPKT